MSANNSTHIRPACGDDAPVLSALALRSKAHWGYSPQFLDACRAELTYARSQIELRHMKFVVLEQNHRVIGFYALSFVSPTQVELEALFVEPTFIGQGHGRHLIEHAKQTAVQLGAETMIIQGDPHAERFYSLAGGMLTGQRESMSIPGRYLPTFSIDLRAVQRDQQLFTLDATQANVGK